jgi:hypothetical protein
MFFKSLEHYVWVSVKSCPTQYTYQGSRLCRDSKVLHDSLIGSALLGNCPRLAQGVWDPDQ